jgi:four helix bundle protein
MNRDELKKRTKEFALRIVKLVSALPSTTAGRVIGNQLLRSGTSVGANYRAACRAKSKSDFIYKINIVKEEADESAFWLELIIESGLMPRSKIEPLLKEADELTAIFVSTNKTAKSKRKI